MADTPNVTGITLHQHSRRLEIRFDDGASYLLPCELLRVMSPSAAVQGHGPGQETLQTGKRDVGIVALDPVGHYGIKPTFTDGHDTGIYTWDYLRSLGERQTALWQDYERRLAAAGVDRDAPMAGGAAPGCGHGH